MENEWLKLTQVINCFDSYGVWIGFSKYDAT